MDRSILTLDDVPKLVSKLYDIKVKVIQELDSYDDQNFHIIEVTSELPPDTDQSAIKTKEYILKILNCKDSQSYDIIELQTDLILHVRKCGYPTSDVIPYSDGNFIKIVQLDTRRCQGEPYRRAGFIVRLFTYIPGMTLDKVPLTLKLCYDIGWFAGKMDTILKGYEVKDLSLLNKMTRNWNLTEVPDLRNILHSVTDDGIRKVAGDIIDHFETQILSNQHTFSRGFIHSDFNECNILVGERPALANNQKSYVSTQDETTLTENFFGADDEKFTITGIIDFGDATYSLYIFEATIAMTYVMLNKHGISPLVAAGHVLAGYLMHNCLSKYEMQHLRLCICARLVQSIVTGYFAFSEDPGNDYILTHASRAWPVLKVLWEMSDVSVLKIFNEICNETN